METLHFSIEGVTPLLMHSAQLADPLNKYARAIKKISSKRTKTDDDHAAMQRLEATGGMYWRDDVGLHVPGECIESCLINAAKLRKLGTTFKRGAQVVELHCPLLKTGAPNSREEIAKDPKFRYVKSVKVGTSRVMRTRPIFESWALTFTVMYDPQQLQREDIVSMAEDAGSMVGIGDFRPRFGKFDVKEVQ